MLIGRTFVQLIIDLCPPQVAERNMKFGVQAYGCRGRLPSKPPLERGGFGGREFDTIRHK